MGKIGLSANSEQAWTDALVALLDDEDLRRRMGAVGRSVVEEHFSLHRLAEQYAAVFQSLGGELPRGNSSHNPSVPAGAA
jgi:glycosyltransferase involved in cell wall biosynthesis